MYTLLLLYACAGIDLRALPLGANFKVPQLSVQAVPMHAHSPATAVYVHAHLYVCAGIDVRALTLEANFKAPLIREYVLLHGLRSVSHRSIRNILTE